MWKYCVSVMFWVIFCLFVLNLLGFGWSRVVRQGRRDSVEMGCFVVVI